MNELLIITLVSVFLMKFADCAMGTLKTVYLVKNKFFISSIFNSVSAALFIYVADSMSNAPVNQKFFIAVTVFLANLIGGYIPPKIINLFETDRLFIFYITPDSWEGGIELADLLRGFDIPINTNVAYDKQINKVLYIKAYAETKQQSKMISDILLDEQEKGHKIKWHIIDAV